MSAKSFRIPECINSVPTCSDCSQVPAIDIHVLVGESMCVVTVHFGGRTPNVPDANGGFSNLIEGCYNLPVSVSDIHVVAGQSTCVLTVHFGGSTPNVPDAYGGSSHCGLFSLGNVSVCY